MSNRTTAQPVTRLYRIVVDRWPTDDGQPWLRFIANPYSGAYGTDYDEPGQEWFRRLVDFDTSPVAGKITEEFGAGDNDQGETLGWILPDPKRRHYLSGSAAKRWVERARLLGAEARVIVSDPVTWAA